MNEYSTRTWLALEIFAVIFVLIMLSSSLPVVTNLPNLTALHAHALVVSDGVLDFHVFGGTNFSLLNEGNTFRDFLFSRF